MKQLISAKWLKPFTGACAMACCLKGTVSINVPN